MKKPCPSATAHPAEALDLFRTWADATEHDPIASADLKFHAWHRWLERAKTAVPVDELRNRLVELERQLFYQCFGRRSDYRAFASRSDRRQGRTCRCDFLAAEAAGLGRG